MQAARALRATCRGVFRSLKPVDVLVLGYLAITAPLLFIADGVDDVVWFGVAIRMFVFPIVTLLRYYLATTDVADLPPALQIGSFAGRKVVLSRAMLAMLALDMYPLVICMYLYAEDGHLIKNLYAANGFFDGQLHVIDAALFSAPISTGLSSYLRSLSPESFNKIFGEYLHICYFSFYFILGGTWPLAWVICAREHFDTVTVTVAGAYLLCLGSYLVMPVKGPFWTYERPDPAEVGYLFSYLTHAIDKSGSSHGTATPSSHCALTVASWGCALIYMLPVGLAYISIAPGLIFSTVWCGFHYGTDALLGCLVGIASIIFGHWLVQVRQYQRPKCDTRYSVYTKGGISSRSSTYDLVPLWRDEEGLDESNEV